MHIICKKAQQANCSSKQQCCYSRPVVGAERDFQRNYGEAAAVHARELKSARRPSTEAALVAETRVSFRFESSHSKTTEKMIRYRHD